MKKLSKILVYSSILIVSIYLSISIAKEYAAHVYLSKFEYNLEEDEGDIERQGLLLRRSLSLSPSNAKTRFELGMLYIDENSIDGEPIDENSEQGKKSYVRSKEILQEALTLGPTDGRKRAEYAWYIGSHGDINEAVEQFNMAIDSSPTDAYLHKLYALWCVNRVTDEIDLTDTDQLIGKYRNETKKEVTLNSYEDRFINDISFAEFLGTAREEWNRVLSLRGFRHRHEYRSLADLNLLEFELDEAIRNYKRAKSRSMQARCYIIKGEYRRALNILIRILKGDGELSESRATKTKKLLTDLIKNDAENYQPHYWLGKLHARLGEAEQAIKRFKLSIQIKPRHIDSHLGLAEIYRQAGKIDLAIEEYETILEKKPNHKEATRLLSEAVLLEYEVREVPKVKSELK
ncbi:MAG: tetratricopeptide repeat protein [Candidatus Scalindua sp.]|nr:tetratricopeptide repeat protein [Candidatus Scalindua sp.]